MRRFSVEELKGLFDIQCGPCMKDYPNCKGDAERAKAWHCREFYSGFFLVSKEAV